jgi:exonuclease SbcD
MKILHTADWHLGKYLDTFSRLEEQREVLEEICEIAERESIDVVIVAGDLFDAFNPPNEASELLYRTLHRLSNQGKRAVIAIAGNHDSPERIDMPDALARENGILFMGFPVAEARPFETRQGIKTLQIEKGFVELQLPDYQYPLRLILTPYANELRLKKYLGKEDREDNLRQMLSQHWYEIANKFCDEKGVNILVSHLYMMQENGVAPEEPDGEKNIMVGGAQAIYTANVPSQIQYVALGHLHRYQDLGSKKQPVVYCGSPLGYSFAEANQSKYVAILNAEPGKSIEIERVVLKSGRKLLRQKFDNTADALIWLSENQVAFVELTMITDKYLASEDIRQLREAHQRIVSIIPIIKNDEKIAEKQEINIKEQSMESLFEQFFENKKGQLPDAALLDLFKEVLYSDVPEK